MKDSNSNIHVKKKKKKTFIRQTEQKICKEYSEIYI